MNLHTLVSDLIGNSLASIEVFVPEIVLCAVMVLLLLARVIKWTERIDAFYIALIGTIAAFYTTGFWQLLDPADPIGAKAKELMAEGTPGGMFTGMLVYDGFTVFMRAILLGFAVLFVILTRLSGIPDKEDGPDIYTLLLGSTLGMCLMASANHLMMVFLAVEMASVPSYALAGMLKGRRRSSEAALKYSVYGAGAAGVMLYGISLIAGIANSVHLPTMAKELSVRLPGMIESAPEEVMVLALGGLMVGVGLAFKLSAVPFHFWCPDVFEGASAEVAAFLSISSKAAALALLVRIAVGIGTVPDAPAQDQVASAALDGNGKGLFSVQDKKESPPEPGAKKAQASPADANGDQEATEQKLKAGADKEQAQGNADDATDAGEHAKEQHDEKGDAKQVPTANDALKPVRDFIGVLVAFLAIVTCTFGNLAAYGQTNIKRLLAYSTIAHAGYMMMAIPPLMAMAGVNAAGANEAVRSLILYLVVYLFMNLAAFAVVAFLRNEMRSEEIADYAGLIKRCPGTVVFLSLALFSLVGLPPLAGFIGKFAIFASVAEGWTSSGQTYLMVLLFAGGINTAISLFYYLRVVKVMTMEPEPESRTPFTLGFFAVGFVFLMTIPTAVLIFMWNGLNETAEAAVRTLLS